MATAQPKSILSAAEYLEIERGSEIRHEFYEGEMFAMTGATRAHYVIVGNAFASLHFQFKGSGCEVYSNDARIRVEAIDAYMYPDLVIVCGERLYQGGEGLESLLNPTALIEVLSPSTEGYDRGLKFEHYRSIPSLREVLFVAQDRPAIERYSRNENGQWLLTDAQGLESTIALPSVGATLALADVYERVLSS